jgi:putative FmdB family regulatory protein
MPIYEYQCEGCGEIFELRQKFADEPLTSHDKCGGAVRRLISASALQFKGSGWYVNDYGKSGAAKSDSKSESKAESKSDSKGDSSKSDSKSDSNGTKSASTESKSSSTESSSKSESKSESKSKSDSKPDSSTK